MGYIDPKMAPHLVNSLRKIKVEQNKTHELHGSVPMTLEVAFLPPGRQSTAARPTSSNPEESKVEKNYYFPGVFLSS